MAVLEAALDNLDGIEDGLKDYYTEKDGKFFLNLNNAGKHPVVLTLKRGMDGLDKKLKDATTKLSEVEAKLAEVPEDFSAEEYARLKASSDKDDPDAKKKFDEQVQKQREILEQKHANALKAKDTEIEKLKADVGERDGYIDRSLADTGLKDALIEVGVEPELLGGALASLRPSVKVLRDETTGDRRAIVETDLGEVDIPSFVKDWSGTKGKAYLGRPTGPDAKGNNRPRPGGKTMSRTEFDKLDPAARSKAIVQDGITVVD